MHQVSARKAERLDTASSGKRYTTWAGNLFSVIKLRSDCAVLMVRAVLIISIGVPVSVGWWFLLHLFFCKENERSAACPCVVFISQARSDDALKSMLERFFAAAGGSSCSCRCRRRGCLRTNLGSHLVRFVYWQCGDGAIACRPVTNLVAP